MHKSLMMRCTHLWHVSKTIDVFKKKRKISTKSLSSFRTNILFGVGKGERARRKEEGKEVLITKEEIGGRGESADRT